ncbi:TonB-dependent receptor [Spirosoma utsteinense]|uniref:Outer membrane receptor protein involved in Fe transport n=1 Tax=Spirosoma utsteinense TaxID=2585773 RepID=A0ABR6W773_9BACT|nr:TonB-dependent receptor [Spirosoma utsteinense]MBC3784880.1 outer membrane receptor protein involved in Fe transport [Spirosoma utsteinense]MBC3792441.1 outer membrane receptor protein involved in Fe transport [Spirosoma utsteinense]
MRKITTHFTVLVWLLCLISISTIAQTRVSGKVTADADKETLAGISVAVKGKVVGTITDTKGNFSFTTNTERPFVIAVTGVGFQPQEFTISNARNDLNISLKEQVLIGQEVVVSASRVEESVLKSPVSVERLDIRSFQSTPAATFYDALQNIKGVDMSTQSLTFKSVNVRGFGSNGNTRVVQLLDGMDNQAPGLNFSVGNLAGVSELDLESVELLPGAASALYGPNAINGLLLMTSKSPFLYQGLSAYTKVGVMNASNRSTATTPFYDAAFRYAKAFNNKFAVKVGVSYLKANDWQATDYRDQSFSNRSTLETGSRANNPGYDGINIYGDASANLYSSLFANGQPGTGANGSSAILGAIATTQIPQAGNRTLPQLTGLTPQQIFNNIIPNLNISRTGYQENDLVNYNATNLKLNGAIHYRLTENVEAIAQANWGTGTTVYTGADRYYIKGFQLGQYKLELRGSNFFVRAYTTQERSGNSYATATLGQGINEAWSGSVAKWFPTYFGTYAQNALTGYAGAYLTALGAGQAPAAALAGAQAYANSQQQTLLDQARGVADQGRLLPGTPGFQQALETVTGKPIPGDATGVGARFLDKTNLYHAEFMYNFSKQIDPKTVELIVGSNFRRYALNSEGTLFARNEAGEEFSIDEYGAYAQASKTLANVLKLTGSVRYDKNQNFKAQISPRFSAVLTVAKQHNLRASFQRGFRIPTTQDQYIDLNTPTARLIGGLPFLKERYNFSGSPVYTLQSVQAFGAALQQGGAAALPQALTQLKPAVNAGYDPERVETYEVGYKGLLGNKLFIDAYYYYNRFLNFLGSQVVVQGKNPVSLTNPVTALQLINGSARNVYSYPVNSPTQLKNAGWAIGADYMLPGNYMIGANVSSNFLMDQDKIPAGFVTFFNTPKYRYNLSFGNRNVARTGFGFNVVYRAQDAFLWEASFANTEATARKQTIIPAYSTLDAQISKKISGIKSILKVGGTNLTGKLYKQSWGNPSVGSMYYVSLTFDELLN